jgi:hypothetical protein
MFMVSREYLFPLLHAGRKYMCLHGFVLRPVDFDQWTSTMTLTLTRALIYPGHVIWKISYMLFVPIRRFFSLIRNYFLQKQTYCVKKNGD